MKPGKELNELIAEKVVKLRQHPDYKHLWNDPARNGSPFIPLPDYSTSIGDAWKVIDVLKKNWKISLAFNGYWECELSRVDQNDLLADITITRQETYAPLAICNAALKSVGHEV